MDAVGINKWLFVAGAIFVVAVISFSFTSVDTSEDFVVTDDVMIGDDSGSDSVLGDIVDDTSPDSGASDDISDSNGDSGETPPIEPDPVAICGNNVIELNEVCDGIDLNGTVCADHGSFNTGSLACDSDCLGFDISNCGVAFCGDGITEGLEECDDGNNNNNDACLNVCRNSFCGDGFKQYSEQCDDGNNQSGDGCSSVCTPERGVCGNGIIELHEECDDGNLVDSDGCSSICEIEGSGPGNGSTYTNDEGGYCDSDANCSEVSLSCVGNVCMALCDPDNSVCASMQCVTISNTDYCAPQGAFGSACMHDFDCLSPLVCPFGTFTCECPSGDSSCITTSCTADYECLSGSCTDGVCDALKSGEGSELCTSHAECDTRLCINGQCALPCSNIGGDVSCLDPNQCNSAGFCELP